METLIKNINDIVVNCKLLFITMLVSTIGTQLLAFIIEYYKIEKSTEYKRLTSYSKNILMNCIQHASNNNDSSGWSRDQSILEHVRLNEMFFRRAFIVCGEFPILLGAYFGICFDVIYLDGTP